MKTIATLTLFALSSIGCMHADPVGRFAHDAFYPTRDHYRVRYVGGTGPTAVLPQGWRLANFDVDANGAAHSRPEASIGFQVTGGRRARVLTGPRYDLHFVHEEGEMFARTVPLSPLSHHESLAQSLHTALSPIVGSSGPDVLGRPWGTNETWLVDEGWARVDERNAYFVTYDLVPRNTNAAVERVTIVAVRAPGQIWRQRRMRVPVLVLFGYATTPDLHDEHRATFETFVRRVDLRPR